MALVYFRYGLCCKSLEHDKIWWNIDINGAVLIILVKNVSKYYLLLIIQKRIINYYSFFEYKKLFYLLRHLTEKLKSSGTYNHDYTQNHIKFLTINRAQLK